MSIHKKLMTVALAILFAVPAFAQKNSADDILGTYYLKDAKNGDSKVQFTKNGKGAFDCTIVWIKNPTDPKTGQGWKDVKNPDKSLRDRPVLGIKIIEGIAFDAQKGVWTGAKVYDPNRGIKANATISLTGDDGLEITG